MKYVLVTVSGGIIDEVKFYDEQIMAIRQLSIFVKAMNPERHDAAVFGPDGMIGNAKAFLDENDQYIEHSIDDVANLNESDESIYIIGNPEHRLGFMVDSSDDPLGYKKPAEALSDLGQMRKDYGSHLKDCEVDDFDYSLVSEYLNELS